MKDWWTQCTQYVSLDAPIKLLETYGCHYVSYYLACSEDTRARQEPNALTILMQNAAGRLVLPDTTINVVSSSQQQLRGDQRLRNDFLHYLEERKVRWNPSVVSNTGEEFVKSMTSALWYLDPHHQQLLDR